MRLYNNQKKKGNLNMKKIIIGIVSILIAMILYLLIFTDITSVPEYKELTQNAYLNGIRFNDMNFFIQNDKGMYINYDWIKKENLADVSWDEKNKTLSYFDGRNLYRIYENNNITKNQELIDLDIEIVFMNDGRPMINSDFLEIKTNYIYEFQKELNRLIVLDMEKIKEVKTTLKTTRVRSNPNYMSQSLDLIKLGEMYFQLEDGDWQKIITVRGQIGYIKSNSFLNKGLLKFIKNIEKIEVPKGINNIRTSEIEKPYEKNKFDKLLNITWHNFTSKTPDSRKLTAPNGIDVVIPTWFSLNSDMSISDIGTKDYMNWARKNKYDVWILFKNGFELERTSKLLNNSLNREQVINKIVAKTIKYGAKGINIDFENVYYKDRTQLTQFIKELYAVSKSKGLILSMDVTFISQSENWSKCYDRKNLSKYLDYMIVMAYDEYWGGRGESGPVASIDWVKNGMEKILKEVSADQIILGIPFYTRVWTENQNTGKITSKAYSMKSAEKFVKNNGIDIDYDEDTQLNYGEIIKKENKYRIWIEDLQSISKRIEIMKSRKLAGIASWRKGFEKEKVWIYLEQQTR